MGGFIIREANDGGVHDKGRLILLRSVIEEPTVSTVTHHLHSIPHGRVSVTVWSTLQVASVTVWPTLHGRECDSMVHTPLSRV